MDVGGNHDEDITAGAKVGKISEASDEILIFLKEEQKIEAY